MQIIVENDLLWGGVGGGGVWEVVGPRKEKRKKKKKKSPEDMFLKLPLQMRRSVAHVTQAMT